MMAVPTQTAMLYVQLLRGDAHAYVCKGATEVY